MYQMVPDAWIVRLQLQEPTCTTGSETLTSSPSPTFNLPGLAWSTDSGLKSSEEEERERVPGCIVKHFSFLLHGSQTQPAFYLLIVFLYITITKQLDSYLLIFSWDLFTGVSGYQQLKMKPNGS